MENWYNLDSIVKKEDEKKGNPFLAQNYTPFTEYIIPCLLYHTNGARTRIEHRTGLSQQ